MTPTTQPKLTDAQVLAWIDNHTCGMPSEQFRTAVAGIIAERDALKVELAKSQMSNGFRGSALERIFLMPHNGSAAEKSMCEIAQRTINVTGTEE